MLSIEDQILFHRYRYYVMDDPLISDFEYDVLERQAREELPIGSPVHSVGSSLASSYPEHIKSLALTY